MPWGRFRIWVAASALAALLVPGMVLAAAGRHRHRPGHPDLRVTAVSASATNVTAGHRITIHDRTLNRGKAVAGKSITAYYLSRRGAPKLRLGARSVNRLAAGAASSGSLTVTVPSSARGTYTLRACADDRRRVAENHSQNRCASARRALTVTTSGGPTPDTTPPTFAGVQSASATSTTAIALAWGPATDDRTPSAAIVYDVYLATSPGGENLVAPPAVTTAPGATAVTVSGLALGTTYYFVVLARDASGNRSQGIVERPAATAPDTTPPVFAGLQALSVVGTGCGVAASTCHVHLAWNAATDDVTPPAAIVYDIYVGSTSGHENFATPAFTSAPGATTYDLSPTTDFGDYFVVRARDANGNRDGNTKEIQAILPP